MLKIIGSILGVLLIGGYLVFAVFTAPKSDKKVLKKFKKSFVKPTLSHQVYKGLVYRKLTSGTNPKLPTIVFVHGAIGSLIDFSKYMKDTALSSKVNMISYDRIGYNYKDKNKVQESIASEVDLLEDLTKNLDRKNTIIIGYSFGGPIALAVKNRYKKIILLAPAVFSEEEKTPFLLRFYKWKGTRWMVPKVWKQASIEKMSHAKDLQNFDTNWTTNKNQILCIQGDKDGIVPYNNSVLLEKEFPKEQFELVTLKGAGHGLIWSHFKEIKQQLLKQLN